MPSKYGPFTPVFDAAVKAVGGLYPAAVFGLVYRHCQMRRGVCDASAESLAALLGCTTKTIYRQLAQLTQDGFLEDRTPGLRNAPHTYSMTPKGLALVGGTLSPMTTPVKEKKRQQQQTTPLTKMTQAGSRLMLLLFFLLFQNLKG